MSGNTKNPGRNSVMVSDDTVILPVHRASGENETLGDKGRTETSADVESGTGLCSSVNTYDADRVSRPMLIPNQLAEDCLLRRCRRGAVPGSDSIRYQ